MKPIKLELREFGAYKHEVIEWNKIINEPMFLITGKTGSGKSTLFDAFSYALYNKTTGGKDVSSLRRKTASDKDKTSVVFYFESKSRLYKIERTLAYLKVGNKNTTPGKVSLTEIVNGKENVLAIKENEVKEKVENIIGLDDKQFCQIIILPQGKFKDFLLSNSSEKKETLRSLFDTYFYQKIVDKLQGQAKNLDITYRLKERELATKFQQFDFIEKLEDIEFVKEENFKEVEEKLEIQKNKVEKHITELELKEKKLEVLRKEYVQLEKINDKFLELEDNKSTYISLATEKENIKDIKETIKHLEELEKHKDSLLEFDKLKEKKISLENQQLELENSKKSLDKSIKENNIQLETLLAKREEIGTLREELARYNYFYDNITKYEEAQKDKELYEGKIKLLDSVKITFEKLKKEVEEIKEDKAEYEEELSISNNILGNIELGIMKKTGEVDKLKSFEKLENNLQNTVKLLEEDEKKLEECYKIKVSLERKIEKIEKNKQQDVLNSFLIHLHQGEDCPLCQQKIIKLPSKIDVQLEEDTTSKKQLDEINKKIIQLETLIKKGKEDAEKLKKELEDKKENVNFSAAKQLKELEVEKEDEKNKEDSFKNKLIKVKTELEQLEKNINQLQEQLLSEEEYKTKLILATSKVEEYDKNINLDINSFKIYYENNSRIVKDYDEKIEYYQKEKNNLVIEERELTINLKNNTNNLQEAIKTIDFNIEKFENSKLKSYYNSMSLAKDNIAELEKISEHKAKVSTYEDKIKIIEDSISRLEKELEKKERPKLEEYSQKLLETEKIVENYKKQVIIHSSTLEKNNELYKELYEEFGILEKNVGFAREIQVLSNVISGKTEAKKSLETYVQGYYLDRVLEAATKRLLQMTNGRYSFERRIEKSRGGGLQGLDIEINDVYLNSLRVVSSLSGGELFLASLSLALGLAEVIQNESGGISLETIFIDEGFGSLDSETLDIAITTLIDLQSHGRNIGIISHVSELKDRIRSKIEVYTEKNYSKVRLTGI